MERKDFSDSDWQTLQFGAFWAWMVISGQDGKVDQNESAAFRLAMDNIGDIKGQLGREVAYTVTSDSDSIYAAWQADPRTAADGLKAAAAIVDRTPGDESNRYKGLLVWLAIKVAAASGSFFGDKISGQERAAIQLLSQLLGYDERDAITATYTPLVLDALAR